MNVISSVCYSDLEVFEAVSKMYLNGDRFDLDPCYSTGKFYKKFFEPNFKFDIVPQVKDVIQADVKHLPIISNSIKSIIFDPPFMFGVHGQTKNNKMNLRFTMFNNFSDLQNMYYGALEEFRRILHSKGIVLFKCQDYTDSKTTLTHCFVYNWAIELGFYVQDIFILVKKMRIYNPLLIQRHARKFHSYYFVFQKI